MLDHQHRPVLTEREILRNLQAIVSDADTTPPSEVARAAVGVLTTENRKHWAALRQNLRSTWKNRSCLEIVDDALFIVCLDDAAPDSVSELCKNFLCGTYHLTGSVQTGTCTNRWYDKACRMRNRHILWYKIDLWSSIASNNCVRKRSGGNQLRGKSTTTLAFSSLTSMIYT